MSKFYRNTFVAVMLLLACYTGYAQQGQITGTVKDPGGVGLPGVNILIKGTTSGTSTDAEGKFSLNAAVGDILVISFIGYSTQEVPVSGQTAFDITLSEDLT